MKFAIKVGTSKKTGNRYRAIAVDMNGDVRVLGFIKDFDGCLLLNLTAYEYTSLADGLYYLNERSN